MISRDSLVSIYILQINGPCQGFSKQSAVGEIMGSLVLYPRGLHVCLISAHNLLHMQLGKPCEMLIHLG